MDEKNALRLLASFAVPPMLLGLCGIPEDKEAFLICAKGGECAGIEEKLNGFLTLAAFMKLLKT